MFRALRGILYIVNARKIPPKNAYLTSIILLILALVILIISTVDTNNNGKLVAKCSEQTAGEVVDTDTQHVYRRRGGSYDKNMITVEFKDKNGKEHTAYYEGKKYFGKGDPVLINYDPTDPDTNYFDAAPPSSGVSGLLWGILCAGLGCWCLFASKHSLYYGG